MKAGEDVVLVGTNLTQIVNLPHGVPVSALRLACTDSNGDYVDGTANLETGSPAFTPYDASTALWDSPDDYMRLPSGSNPDNPITMGVHFSDETGCSSHTYRFWIFDDGGDPVHGAGTVAELVDGWVVQNFYLSDGVGVEAVRLACVDENGDIVDSSSTLESGSPSFTPHGMLYIANWDDPANYTRSPSGSIPENPVTFSVQFSHETGCSNQTYRFWVYDDLGSPVQGLGTNTSLDNMVLSQEVSLPDGVGVEAIRLVCTDSGGDIDDVTSDLEAGSPAFTPYDDVIEAHWQNPANYARSPSGSSPTNPITFSVDFNDETGCPTQIYSFWLFEGNGTPIGPVGPSVTLVGTHLEQTVSLADNVDVETIRLACVDAFGGRADSGSDLEAGSPSFTPQDP
ncbi:MAG: hypothetical protein ABIO72_00110 [Patescibacteria group bacterium]